MFTTLLQKIGAGIASVALAFSSFFTGNVQAPEVPVIAPQEEQVVEAPLILGATPQFVGGKIYNLSGSGILSSDTSIPLVSFTLPVNDQEIQATDLGNPYYVTIEPNSTTKKEFVSCTGVTQSAVSSAATLTGCTRGLLFVSPYTASSSLRQSHSGGSRVVLSNPPQLYQSILDYINNATTSGAVDASTLVKGLVEISTGLEAASTTPVGGGNTSAPLALSTAISTSSSPVSGHVVPITGIDGNLSEGFLPTTFTSPHTFSATTTLATTTVTGTFTVNGATVGSSTVRVFTASSTWTKLPGLISINVCATGGGGAGGSHKNSGSTDTPGGGGGGGGTACRNIAAASLAATETVTVGSGGAAAAGSSGQAGSASSFGSFVSGAGGSGGNYDSTGAGGAGGAGTGGDINVTGGGGGGVGGAANNNGGQGGSSFWGGGAPSSNSTGIAGTSYGGGGGGGGGSQGADTAGGAGGFGVVYVKEQY